MDIEKFRENQKKHYENNLVKRQIRKQIKDTLDKKQSRQFESKELFKPVITSQKEVKETIDKKQDKLIEKLNEKQDELIEAVDALNETISLSGSQVGVKNWLSGLPSSFDPAELDPILEEPAEAPKDEEDEEDEEEEVPENTLTNIQKEIIKRQGFDPDLKDIPNRKTVVLKIQKQNGKSRSTDKRVAKKAAEERQALSDYLILIKEIELKKKTGKGIRTYRQPKRNAYKINNGQYGGLLINVPRLINEMVIEAVKDGKKVYEDIADKSLVDLITKRFDPKKKYSSKAIKIFNNLNMLSKIPKHRSSGKSKLIGGAIIYSDPKDLMKRLTLLTGNRRAGNTGMKCGRSLIIY